MRTLAIAAALGAAGFISAPAHAQMVMLNFSFPEMRQQLTDQKATITNESQTDDGLRYLSAKTDAGLIFSVYGIQCDTNEPTQRCTGAEMIASFTLADPTQIDKALDLIDYAALSDYKGSDGNLKLSRYVIFDNDITPANLKTNIEVFLGLANQAWDKLDDAKLLK